MGINELVLDIAFISNDTTCSTDLRDIVRGIAQRLVPVVPQTALREWKGTCEHSLIVVDGYALGYEALVLCRRLRLSGVARPIVLAWLHSTDLDCAACREFGADSVVSPPFVADKVAAAMLATVGNWPSGVGGMARKPRSEERC